MGNESNRAETRMEREEGRWRTTKFGLRSGVIGIRRRATSRKIAQSMGAGEAICTMHEVVAVVNRPQDIEDEEANEFLRGIRGRCRRKSG
jgi:hypothetical protein